jgi:hypothetical protein
VSKVSSASQGAEQVAWYTRYVYQNNLEESPSLLPIYGSGIAYERKARLSNLRHSLSTACGDLFEYCGEDKSQYLVRQFANSSQFFDSVARGIVGSFCLFLQSRYRQFPVIAASASVIALRYAVSIDDAAVLASLPIHHVEDEFIELKLRASVVDEHGRFDATSIGNARPEMIILRATFNEDTYGLLTVRPA